MKNIARKIIFTTIDILALPVNFIFLPLLWALRRYGIMNFPLNRKLFRRSKVLPIIDHYYEPKFIYSDGFDASKKRKLPINFREQEQLALLSSFTCVDELKQLSADGKPGEGVFFLNNGSFGAGDAEMYYLMIRHLRPKRIIEIGSGNSTLVAKMAVKKNEAEGFPVQFTCIEPYEMPWLEKVGGIEVKRQRVEEMPVEFFGVLEENDILFIDSSHIIRPENDVLFEFLEILPSLKKGVWIHIHDIFSPRHYRQDWLQDMFRLWNEQYLLEAFLCNNDHFEITGSLNYLKNDFFDTVQQTFINLKPGDEPASFWIRKVK
jgi:hypothetical protein